MAEKTAAKQRGKPFSKGKSGNPDGRPPGSRNKTTIAMEALLDGEGEELTRVAIARAKAGDMTAMKLCMERLSPPRKDRHVSFEIPNFSSAKDAVQISAALVRAVSESRISPSEAAEVGKLIEAYVRTLASSELEDRIQRLEKVVGESRAGRSSRASDYLEKH